MSNSAWGRGNTQFFFQLGPDQVLAAMEELGKRPTGRCLPLNSMENRVYEVELERPDTHELFSEVVKFYRPGRWSKDQIQEEHDFLWDLKDQEIPVIAPQKIQGKTLFEDQATTILYTTFPKQGGRLKDEYQDEELEQLGRLIARIHQTGSVKSFEHRLKLDADTYILHNLEFLNQGGFLPPDIAARYTQTAHEIAKLATEQIQGVPFQRIHGDCHLGNIIWRETTAWAVDFDDCVSGPVAQDIWPLIPGADQEAIRQRHIFLDAYESIRPFPRAQLKLIEALRSLRMIHFSSWIARRWEDPAFKNAFPYFESNSYWPQQYHYLVEQLELMRKAYSDLSSEFI